MDLFCHKTSSCSWSDNIYPPITACYHGYATVHTTWAFDRFILSSFPQLERPGSTWIRVCDVSVPSPCCQQFLYFPFCLLPMNCQQESTSIRVYDGSVPSMPVWQFLHFPFLISHPLIVDTNQPKSRFGMFPCCQHLFDGFFTSHFVLQLTQKLNSHGKWKDNDWGFFLLFKEFWQGFFCVISSN